MIKKEDLKEKFEILKTKEDFVILPGEEKILISCPHAVPQTRNGEIKFAEPETAYLALCLNESGFPCIIKTSNENDDANFDENSNYKINLLSFTQKQDIKFVLDLHELRPDRTMDLCIGTGSNDNKNLLTLSKNISEFVSIFSKDFIASLNEPFMASSPNTISGFCYKNNIPSMQLEINSRNLYENVNFEGILNIIEIFLENIKGKIK